MRYKEAYELIDASLISSGTGLPATQELKNIFLDKSIEEVGLRTVRKRTLETFTGGGKEFIFTNDNYSEQVYKVEVGDKVKPMLPETAISSGADEDDIVNNAWFLKTDNSATGDISAIALGGSEPTTDTTVTSALHGLDTGDYVIFSEIEGVLATSTSRSAVNDRRLAITKVDDNNFTFLLKSYGYTAHTSNSGKWIEDTNKIHFTKSVDSGDTVRVYYYAKPEARPFELTNYGSLARIDLPSSLIPAIVHYTVSHLLEIAGDFETAALHGKAGQKIESMYYAVSRNREAMPDILSPALQDFV